jgi:hypothetical protein
MGMTHSDRKNDALAGETRSLTPAEFERAMRAERDDHSMQTGGAPVEPTSIMFGKLSHVDRWGVLEYGSISQNGDGPIARRIDRKALAQIKTRNVRLTRRAKLAARARTAEKARSRAGVKARRLKLDIEPLDTAASAYVLNHPGCGPAELASHLRPKFRKAGESNKSYYQRIFRCARRIGIPVSKGKAK